MPSSRSTLTSFLLFSTFALPAVAQVRRLSNFPQQSQLPLTFEPNVGQTDSEVRYVARGGGQTLFLTEDHAVLNLVALEQGPMGGARNARSLKSQKLHGATIRMGFRNSQAPGSIEPLDPLPGKINYLKGNDPSKWHTDVPTYGRVAFRDLYPGIDLVYYGQQGALEYDFVAKAGANPNAIQVQFEGADRMRLNEDGDLILESPAGQVRWKKPNVYQEDHGVRRPVAAEYRLEKGSRVGFQLAKYNRKLPLVIDPQLTYATFLGGSLYDSGGGVWVDTTGIYLVGTTYSFNFPAMLGSLHGEYDVFITKLNPQGNAVIYSDYLGGSDHDSSNSSWLAPDGSMYLTGFTSSFDFPVTPGAYSTFYHGGLEDAFVCRISPAGNALIFSTYLGGSNDDDAFGMWVDVSGNIYLTGETASSFDFPITPGAFQQSFQGGTNDAFVTKMNPTGTALVYSTFLGGSGDEETQNQLIGNVPPNLVFVYGSQITVDPAGNAYVSGFTTSTNFPTTAGAYSRLNHGGGGDGYVVKLNPTGTGLVWSTLLGGSGFDAIQSNQTFPDGSVLVAGVTRSSDFPTTQGAYRRSLGGGAHQTGFVARFDPTGSQLTYATYFGGSNAEAFVVAFEGGNGSVLVSGLTFSADIPTTPGTYQPTYAGGGDVFLSFFDSTITSLIDSTYLGTSAYDSGSGYFSPASPFDVLVSGGTGGSNFPTTAGADQRTYGGGASDAFIARFVYSGGCNEPVSPTTVPVGAAGGIQTVNITTLPGCLWFAYNTVPWVSFASNAYGSGSGSVSFSVQPNSGVARTARVEVAGQPVTVQQAAGGGSCTFTLSSSSATFTAAGGVGTVNVTASAQNCTWTSVSNVSWVAIFPASGTGNGTVSYLVAADPTNALRAGTLTIAGLTYTVTQGSIQTAGLRFVPVTPCRVMDTRGPTGLFGGPSIAGGTSRDVPIPQSACNIPSGALAYSLNVTVVPPGALIYLSIWPTGQPQPLVSTLNSFDGRIVANAAIVPAGTNGSISVFVSNNSDVIIDINGYFAPASTPSSLAFYAVTPCRVADTRGPAGTFGAPFLSGGTTRSFPIPASPCGVPSTAQAYSFNITVVPHGPLGYLTSWPAGQTQPLVSTLNSFDGSVVANAAIVPAGTNGSVSIFVTDATEVIMDINGYFAAPGSAGAEALYAVTPCRVADTRGPAGIFGGPSLVGSATRTFPIPSSACSIPATAQAYSLNVTVVPPGPLTYLTAWPTGQPQPLVSTLNSFAGKVVANAAILPAGTGGPISVFVTNNTDLILDINGYFAP